MHHENDPGTEYVFSLPPKGRLYLTSTAIRRKWFIPLNNGVRVKFLSFQQWSIGSIFCFPSGQSEWHSSCSCETQSNMPPSLLMNCGHDSPSHDRGEKQHRLVQNVGFSLSRQGVINHLITSVHDRQDLSSEKDKFCKLTPTRKINIVFNYFWHIFLPCML